jgi:hypothetical protein
MGDGGDGDFRVALRSRESLAAAADNERSGMFSGQCL